MNIPADNSVRFLSNVLEELDYTELYGAYSRKEKISAVSPKNLFKILVYAYMNYLYSTRQIETACKRDINFMYLLEGANAPDHNTILWDLSIDLSENGQIFEIDQAFRQNGETLEKVWVAPSDGSRTNRSK